MTEDLKVEPRIAVVYGGPSAEAEVSRVSGRAVANALEENYNTVELVELDRNTERLLEGMQVVFPALHGPPGEDGTFQGFLEILGIPYVGSGVHASAAAMDKVLAKHLFAIAGLPVAPERVLSRGVGPDEAAKAMADLGGSVVVKPSRQGSALGVSFCQTPGQLDMALRAAFRYDEHVLMEAFVKGKEITAAVLEREGVEVLPVIEVRTPAGAWYDYEHRYTPGLSDHVIPAEITEAQRRRVAEVARGAFVALGCRDFARADFVVPENGEPVLLEVNTLPGMTPTSLFPDAARAAGLPFPDLVAHLVERAWARRAR